MRRSQRCSKVVVTCPEDSRETHCRAESTGSRPTRRAMAGNAPRPGWHTRYLRHISSCNLQILKEIRGFESHSLRHLSNLESILYGGFISAAGNDSKRAPSELRLLGLNVIELIWSDPVNSRGPVRRPQFRCVQPEL